MKINEETEKTIQTIAGKVVVGDDITKDETIMLANYVIKHSAANRQKERGSETFATSYSTTLESDIDATIPSGEMCCPFQLIHDFLNPFKKKC